MKQRMFTVRLTLTPDRFQFDLANIACGTEEGAVILARERCVKWAGHDAIQRATAEIIQSHPIHDI